MYANSSIDRHLNLVFSWERFSENSR